MCAQLTYELIFFFSSFLQLFYIQCTFVWLNFRYRVYVIDRTKVLCSMAAADADNVVSCYQDMNMYILMLHLNEDVESYL